MNFAFNCLKIASVSALACVLSLGIAEAAQKSKTGMSEESGMQQGDCDDGENCGPENGTAQPQDKKTQQNDKNGWKKKPQDNAGNDDEGQNRKKKSQGNGWDNNDNGNNKKSQANSNWRYDSNKHKRNKYKDQRYKYYYGGFWYLEPYWNGPGYGYRVSCGEGREIVRDNGFNRVKVMECEGRNYTYAGSRRGVPFRIVLNSRSGDIVSARPM